MGIFQQKHPQYGGADSIGVIRDIMLATGFLLSDSVRGKYEKLAIDLIAQNPKRGADLRNSLFASKDALAQRYPIDTSNLVGADAQNAEYHRLLAIRDQLMKNPQATLVALQESIEDTFRTFGIRSFEIDSIGKIVSTFTDANFAASYEKITKDIGHLGSVFFLEGCMTAGKSLDMVLQYARDGKATFSKTKKRSFEYWNFHNVERLAEIKIKLQSLANEVQSDNAKAFVLSGGAGNTLASLGVIVEHLESGGTITAISGTSMGGALAAIVGSIGNDASRIQELMQDIAEGFIFEGEHYSITELNLYIPGVPLLVKGFIEKIMIKYGIQKDTKFADLKIPVIINAGRQYWKGEQEVVLSGGDSVHDSILASMNIPFPGIPNTGGLGRTKIDGVAMIDYAANERGNPTHWLQSLGIPEKDMIVVDAGYSSETWVESYGTATRKRFGRATQRDNFAKGQILLPGGMVLNINSASAGEGGGGKMSSQRTKRLYELGKEAYKSHNKNGHGTPVTTGM